ncbi:TetR/AcrR family transcriptional regulator [Bacillus massiliigorillae]|uniref:TetR/AcrR family transcriptional regulator n=1 Tax=Bacillus massiliigorillae TaxID=1243664 RepID=UPI0003A4C131|nr:TetR/AcrR family transcriptional regulator [Bacillus massiliigorillae]
MVKDNIIALHQKNIADGAASLFINKGFTATSINDISKLAGYSRRTIYKYFESKEEILYYLIIEGLEYLIQSIEEGFCSCKSFISRYEHYCECMLYFYENYPISAQSVDQFQSKAYLNITPSVERIFTLGENINDILALWIKEGKEEGVLEESLETLPTVYILSSNIHALLKLITTKGSYILTYLQMTKEEFLSHGYTMNLKSILK